MMGAISLRTESLTPPPLTTTIFPMFPEQFGHHDPQPRALVEPYLLRLPGREG